MQQGKNNLQKAVLGTIERYSLVKEGDRVLVGLSGGADSMCLTQVLCAVSDRLKIEVAAAHLNHNIRGEAAERDAAAAESFARGLGIEFFLRSSDVKGFARERRISEELAGRELRYGFFDELCEKRGFTRVATAHNRNDNAETLLMNFTRGSGLAGLCGIPPQRGRIIRPLIDVSRSEIEEYCREYSLPYVTDATNLEAVYTRNRVRLEIIPQLQRLNKNFINTVTANAALLADENSYLDAEARSAFSSLSDGVSCNAAMIAALHTAIARRVIRLAAESAMGQLADISSRSVNDILALCRDGRTGRQTDAGRGYIARISYGRLYITDRGGGGFDLPLKEDCEVIIPEAGMRAVMTRCGKRVRDGAIYLSCDDINDIHIRSRREGDIFYPSGMSGRKKLKEFLIDKKIPSHERDAVPIITIGGEIAAVSDMRVDRRFLFGEKSFGIRIVLNNTE